jgi:hypothetical protein
MKQNIECKCECHNPMSKWERCTMCESHHSPKVELPEWEMRLKEMEGHFDILFCRISKNLELLVKGEKSIGEIEDYIRSQTLFSMKKYIIK